MALISEETVALVRGVAAEAERLETPCGDGHMVWHVWGTGPPLVLLHGGYGSWTHWIRNVLPLSRAFTVAAPDLPGLGESATPPEPHTADGLARIIVEGIDIAFPRPADLRIAGFSFGGVLGGRVAVQFGERRTHRAVGSKAGGSHGPTRSPEPFLWSRRASTGSGESVTPPPIPISTTAPARCATFSPAPASSDRRGRSLGAIRSG